MLAESLTLAFMVLLDTLSPEERAVFVLREALEYSFGEIASVLTGTEANCRQLFHRAKERLRSGQSRSARSGEQTGSKSSSSRSTTTRRCSCAMAATLTPSMSVRSRATRSSAFVSSATLTSWCTSLAS